MPEDDAPKMVCPKCGEPVFKGDTVCGFCGAVLTEPPPPKTWIKAKTYKFSPLVLISSYVLFGGLAIGCGYEALDGFSKANQRGGWTMLAFAIIFVAIVLGATYASLHEQITVFDDRVDWTNAFGQNGSCPIAELTIARRVQPKGGVYYRIGRSGGPYFDINSDIEDHEDLVDDLMLRTGTPPESTL